MNETCRTIFLVELKKIDTRLLEVESDSNGGISAVREARVTGIAISIANSTAFPKSTRIRNSRVYRICHFRFPEIVAMYIGCSCTSLRLPVGRRFSKLDSDRREDWSPNVKDPDWQKDSIRWKRPDPIYWDTLELDCNLGQPILISLTGDARLF